MGELTIKYADKRHKKGSIKINKLATRLPNELKKAFGKVGGILTKRLTKNLSGKSHTRYPNTRNPFPGVISGALKGSANWRLLRPWGVQVGVGGAASSYTVRQEKLYPYMAPTWHKEKDKVLKVLFKYITGSMK